jgi:hypothetical protein
VVTRHTRTQQPIFHAAGRSAGVALYRPVSLCIKDPGQYCMPCSFQALQIVNAPAASLLPLDLPLSQSCLHAVGRLAPIHFEIKVCMHRSTQEAGEWPATTVDQHEVQLALTFLCSEWTWIRMTQCCLCCLLPRKLQVSYVWLILLSFEPTIQEQISCYTIVHRIW